jgi:hypothetical protein
MESGDEAANDGRKLDASKLDAVDECLALVEQAQVKLDSIGQSMASVHLNHALESLRALRVRVRSGLD